GWSRTTNTYGVSAGTTRSRVGSAAPAARTPAAPHAALAARATTAAHHVIRTILRVYHVYCATCMADRPRPEEGMQKISPAARSCADRLRSQAGVDTRELIDPEGESVASLVDVEGSPGAAALALPMDLITFETWVLGHVSDRDELDLDVGAHKDLWFGFGAWIGEALRHRHGGVWLFPAEDPHAWHLGFSKILLEIAPHVFAGKVLQAGGGGSRARVSAG